MNVKKEKREDFSKCFANHDGTPACYLTNCSVLTEPLCKTRGECPFFKTKEIYDYERVRSKIRLAKLGLDDMYIKTYGNI